ncbi:hypothetical protein C1645_838675 [Glomus cerebriforme]|uniref:Uncharacterized protein n=1 Tax=Glomus cerebriforme TaxID=658196 RepID=A0A397S6S3_9GLOM|nr:hypothetical protein C1645_838675 [Glomus cerebriforme]
MPPILQQHHWEMAARNCKKFLQKLFLRANFFNIIGYNDAESDAPRVHPEWQRFQLI